MKKEVNFIKTAPRGSEIYKNDIYETEKNDFDHNHLNANYCLDKITKRKI